jgi:hypothetical protein
MKIESAKDLDVYKLGYQLAMDIFELTRTFPSEERYALTSQIRRSSHQQLTSRCAEIGRMLSGMMRKAGSFRSDL